MGFFHFQARAVGDVRSGIVNRDVDMAEFTGRGGYHAFQILQAPHVTCDWLDRRTDLLRDLIERLLLAAANDDLRAFANEYLGDRPADPAACAGYNCDF